ncbi:MAG: NAD(P)/FAD-dependent oxidoreductase [Chthoniobacterales bacterium]
MSTSRKIIVIGGGAAGFFGAIAAAENGASVTLLERGSHFLSKVRISGGGRCNVTHACFDPRELSTRYPRGGRALIGPFNRFQSRDTMEWFESRGAALKIENDGRVFPVSDSSQTIIDTLMNAAQNAGVVCRLHGDVTRLKKNAGEFHATLANGEILVADRVLLAAGGTRAASVGKLAAELGHTLASAIPSLFTFEIHVPWLRDIPGVVAEVEASIPAVGLRERGPMLVTHWGGSGPSILRLSAWGARGLAELDYQFPLFINWLGGASREDISNRLTSLREKHPAKQVTGLPPAPLPARLWEKLTSLAEVAPGTTWNRLPRAQTQKLIELLHRTELPVTGKSLNKDEFVTCGGVVLPEVDFRTMESRVCPGLHLAGEILDIDGITGGYNFQAAWTTGHIAGTALAATS